MPQELYQASPHLTRIPSAGRPVSNLDLPDDYALYTAALGIHHHGGCGWYEFLNGADGVSIFVVTGGFLITSLLRKEQGTRSLRAVLVRRLHLCAAGRGFANVESG